MGAAQGTATIVILKPDTTIRGDAAAAILQKLLNHGFIPLQAMEIVASPDIIRQHYQTSFRQMDVMKRDLTIRYMCSASVLVLRFTDNINGGKGVVQRMRIFAGNSSAPKSKLYILRSEFLINEFINSIHSSDTEQEAQRELEVWRPHFENMPQRIDATQFVQQYIARNTGNSDPSMDVKNIRNTYTKMCKEIWKLKYSFCDWCGETEYARNLEMLKGTVQIRDHRDTLISQLGAATHVVVETQPGQPGGSPAPLVQQNPNVVTLVDVMIEYACKYEKNHGKMMQIFLVIVLIIALVCVVIGAAR